MFVLFTTFIKIITQGTNIMKTILKTFSIIGVVSLLFVGVYTQTTEQTTENINTGTDSFVIEPIKPNSVQLPIAENNTTDKTANDLQGVKVVPKPEPVKTPVVKPAAKPVVKPIVKPEPVKEKPVVQEKPTEKPAPVKKEIQKPVEKKKPIKKLEPEKPKTDNVKAIDRAKDITKGYCAPELWVKWEPEEQEGEYIGLAYRTIEYYEDKSQEDLQTITTMISPELDGDIDISIHTAWHECAHAKTYSIPLDKADETIKEIKKAFPETKHNRVETLADAMATVKTKSTENNYYHSDFTKEQLKVAEKVWNLSPEIQPTMVYDYEAWEKISTLY